MSKNIIISEGQFKRLFEPIKLLIESMEGKSRKRTYKVLQQVLPQYSNMWGNVATDNDGKPILTQKGKTQTILEYLENILRDKFFHNGKSNIKFESGVARIAYGELGMQANEDAEGLNRLNQIVQMISEAHADEYDWDLNGLTYNDLNTRFGQVVQDQNAAERQANIDQYGSQQTFKYTIQKINSFEDAKAFYEYTNPNSRWCLTHMESMWDSYTNNGCNVIYFAYVDNFKEIKPITGENTPLDEYGLSLLSIIIDMDGNLAYCTCRWNHDNGGSDGVMDANQLSQVLGCSVYSACPPYSEEELRAKGIKTPKLAMEMLAQGHKPEDVFDNVHQDLEPSLLQVHINNKANYLKSDGQILSPDLWFDAVGYFLNGFAQVKLNGKWNYLNLDGQILSPDLWFTWVGYFEKGPACVALNYKYNYLKPNGQLVSPDLWFHSIEKWEGSFGCVYLARQWKYIDMEGNLHDEKPIQESKSHKDINIIISESQYKRLFENVEDEGVELTSTGTKQHPTMNVRFNSSLNDADNAVVNQPQYGKNQVNIDTRMSNAPWSVLRGKHNGNSNVENTLYYGYGYRLMDRVKIFANAQGRIPFNMYNDEERWENNREMTPRILTSLRGLKTRAMNAIQKAQETGDYERLYNWASKWGMDKDHEQCRAHNLVRRAQSGQDRDFGGGTKMPTYQVGLVPGTNIKVISLFKFNDFNISDAIKNGTMRPTQQMLSYTGEVANEKNKIPVTYDDGIPADVYNNFSKDANAEYDGVNHFKKSYGYEDKNYTSVTQFIDKSIMYAAYALKKEHYSPDFIVAAPSSSQFNRLYATALANKLGTAQFIDDFFQRNLINFTDEQGQEISEKMRNDGIDEKLITQFITKTKGIAMEELAAVVAGPVRRLVTEYYHIFADIAKDSHSREKVNTQTVERVIAQYFYGYMVRDMQNLKATGEVGKYLLEKFEASDKYIYGTDKYVANEIRKRVKWKVGKRIFVGIINEMWQVVQKMDKQLKGRGYKLQFTQKFKITELSRKLRAYLDNLYVVADKNFNKNSELFTEYQQGKFLIIDDDVNSGGSLKSTVYALGDVVPDENPDKLMCLVNAYYGGGF